MSNFDRERMQEMAVFADAAYKRTPAARRKDLNQHGLKNWNIDPQLSTKTEAVFVNTNTEEVVLSIRGTDLRDFKSGGSFEDLLADGMIGVGIEKASGRFKRAEDVLLKAQKKYPGQKLTLSAHSLGGTLSSDLSLKYNLENHSFNSGSSPAMIRVGRFQKFKLPEELRDETKNNHNYTTGSDIISIGSIFSPFNNTHIIKTLPGENSHSINNFLPPAREETAPEYLGSHHHDEFRPPPPILADPLAQRLADLASAQPGSQAQV